MNEINEKSCVSKSPLSIFNLLYIKKMEKSGVNVRIPLTLVFHNSYKKQLYSYNKKTQCIERISGKEVTQDLIIKKFRNKVVKDYVNMFNNSQRRKERSTIGIRRKKRRTRRDHTNQLQHYLVKDNLIENRICCQFVSVEKTNKMGETNNSNNNNAQTGFKTKARVLTYGQFNKMILSSYNFLGTGIIQLLLRDESNEKNKIHNRNTMSSSGRRETKKKVEKFNESSIRVLFTPYCTMIEKREGIDNSDSAELEVDKGKGCGVWDKPVYQSRSVFVSAKMKLQVEKLCQKIVRHVSRSVSGMRVKLMVMYVKLHKKKLYFLYASRFGVNEKNKNKFNELNNTINNTIGNLESRGGSNANICDNENCDLGEKKQRKPKRGDDNEDENLDLLRNMIIENGWKKCFWCNKKRDKLVPITLGKVLHYFRDFSLFKKMENKERFKKKKVKKKKTNMSRVKINKMPNKNKKQNKTNTVKLLRRFIKECDSCLENGSDYYLSSFGEEWGIIDEEIRDILEILFKKKNKTEELFIPLNESWKVKLIEKEIKEYVKKKKGKRKKKKTIMRIKKRPSMNSKASSSTDLFLLLPNKKKNNFLKMNKGRNSMIKMKIPKQFLEFLKRSDDKYRDPIVLSGMVEMINEKVFQQTKAKVCEYCFFQFNEEILESNNFTKFFKKGTNSNDNNNNRKEGTEKKKMKKQKKNDNLSNEEKEKRYEELLLRKLNLKKTKKNTTGKWKKRSSIKELFHIEKYYDDAFGKKSFSANPMKKHSIVTLSPHEELLL